MNFLYFRCKENYYGSACEKEANPCEFALLKPCLSAPVHGTLGHLSVKREGSRFSVFAYKDRRNMPSSAKLVLGRVRFSQDWYREQMYL